MTEVDYLVWDLLSLKTRPDSGQKIIPKSAMGGLRGSLFKLCYLSGRQPPDSWYIDGEVLMVEYRKNVRDDTIYLK